MKKLSKKYYRETVIILTTLFPSFAFAQFTLANSRVGGVIMEIIGVVRLLLPVLVGVAFIFFFWGVAKFVLNSGNAQEVATGKNYIIWGVVAIFVLLSFMGIVYFLAGEFGFEPSYGGVLPTGPRN